MRGRPDVQLDARFCASGGGVRRRTRALARTAVLALAALAALPPPGAAAAVLDEQADAYQWRLCPAARLVPLRPGYTDPATDPESIEIRADAARIVEQGLSQFTGDVEVVRGEQSMSAEVITYDGIESLFTAEGRAHLWGAGVTWAGERALYDPDTEVATLSEGRYWLLDGRGRGYASRLRDDRAAQTTVLHDVHYSTCPMAEEAWRLSAGRIKLDHETDRGSALNAVLRVRNVPVFYFPYVTFPLSDKRKSGFLAPTLGTTNDSGIDVRTPYYWNIAPDRDATLTPRVLTDRGGMIEGEYRYLGAEFEGRTHIEYLPSDRLRNDGSRSLAHLEHTHYFLGRKGHAYALFNNVSDDEYFEDFGSSISTTSQRFLDRQLMAEYRDYGGGTSTYLRGIVQAYQTIDPTIPEGSKPYRRLPQIEYYGTLPGFRRFTPLMRAQTTYFHRDVGLTGGRIDLEPALQYTWWRPHLLIRPKVALHRTDYILDDPNGAFDDHVSRTVPKLTVDANLFLERDLNLFGANLLQTLEPRLFYLLVPKVDQDDIPRFDTGLYAFAFTNIFLENRFGGRDRIGDANQVTAAVTSRLLDVDSGRERARLSLGQIYFFRDREVVLPGGTEQDDAVSEFIADAAAELGYGWSVRGTVQWDPNAPRTEKAAATLRFRPNYETVVNLGYRLRRAVTDVEQTDVSFRLPLLENLAIVGRWNFSLPERRSLETVGGVEYESCCWGVRVVGRRFLLNADGDFDTGVFVQVHFRGLGGIGQDAGSLLRRGIAGYDDPFE